MLWGYVKIQLWAQNIKIISFPFPFHTLVLFKNGASSCVMVRKIFSERGIFRNILLVFWQNGNSNNNSWSTIWVWIKWFWISNLPDWNEKWFEKKLENVKIEHINDCTLALSILLVYQCKIILLNSHNPFLFCFLYKAI